MTYEIRGLKAKVTRRDKRIADLMAENADARKLLKDAINSARMIARENAMLKNNAAIKTSDHRIAQQLERLRHAEDMLTLAKAAGQYLMSITEIYEHRARKQLPYEVLTSNYGKKTL